MRSVTDFDVYSASDLVRIILWLTFLFLLSVVSINENHKGCIFMGN